MKKINIKGRDYKLILTDNDILVKDKKCDGACDILTKTIYIRKRQYEEEKENLCLTFVHELTHAFFYECGFVDYSKDENLMYFFEHQFLDILTAFTNCLSYMFPKSKKEVNKALKIYKDLILID